MSENNEEDKHSIPSKMFPQTSLTGDSDDNEENCSHANETNHCDKPKCSRKRVTTENEHGGTTEAPRREENPFSFKHFLSRETSNWENTGARPKVYAAPAVSNPAKDYGRATRGVSNMPEMTSALPDFVQDHLVVEQCYLRDNNVPGGLSIDLDNLPDFAVNEHTVNDKSVHYDNSRRVNSSDIHNVPLDLPVVPDQANVNNTPPTGGIPFDLPLVRDANVSNCSSNNSGSLSPAQPTVSKSLPDFLYDGPIRGHLPPADVTANNGYPNQSIEDRLQTENERLRIDLEMLRGQNTELLRRIQTLRLKLDVKEHEETVSLEKAIEQAENNLQRTLKRAVTAENTVSKLRQEVKSLSTEVSQLRQENWELRGGEGSSRGEASKKKNSNAVTQQVQMQHFVQDLRAAATSAEASLRQLLSGVDNLRYMASSLENSIDDRSKDCLSESDGDGPA